MFHVVEANPCNNLKFPSSNFWQLQFVVAVCRCSLHLLGIEVSGIFNCLSKKNFFQFYTMETYTFWLHPCLESYKHEDLKFNVPYCNRLSTSPTFTFGKDNMHRSFILNFLKQQFNSTRLFLLKKKKKKSL